MDKVCATCGKQLQADQGFCDQCGSAWNPAVESAPAIPAANPIGAQPQPVVQVNVAPARGGGAAKAVIAVLIVIVALALGGWFFLRSRSVVTVPLVATSSTTSVTTTSATSSATATGTAPAAVAGAVVPPVTDTTTSSTSTAETPATIAAATTAAENSKPCSVITRAEMGAILSAKIVKLTATEATCAYFTNADASAQIDTIWKGGKAALAETKGFNSAEGLFVPVPAIGDEAYFQAAGVLHVLKGDTYIVVNSREYPNELEIESAIARKILEKMK